MAKKDLTREDVLELLWAKVKEFGTQARLAKEIGVTEAYLSYVLNGVEPPGPTILNYLGIEKKTIYLYVRK